MSGTVQEVAARDARGGQPSHARSTGPHHEKPLFKDWHNLISLWESSGSGCGPGYERSGWPGKEGCKARHWTCLPGFKSRLLHAGRGQRVLLWICFFAGNMGVVGSALISFHVKKLRPQSHSGARIEIQAPVTTSFTTAMRHLVSHVWDSAVGERCCGWGAGLTEGGDACPQQWLEAGSRSLGRYLRCPGGWVF